MYFSGFSLQPEIFSLIFILYNFGFFCYLPNSLAGALPQPQLADS